ncbi:unnamed protein product [Microthlaspi erraticum]|uniref:Uncharacterized protein n=1 Tax=Microthlaspi erraticum TaxID=1685480 RepID=A0A6D2KYV3_9BRAS|nr:unnamed protein product [Microthlaspi erraticum]
MKTLSFIPLKSKTVASTRTMVASTLYWSQAQKLQSPTPRLPRPCKISLFESPRRKLHITKGGRVIPTGRTLFQTTIRSITATGSNAATNDDKEISLTS